ncbi:unnamed protein product [Durusdinium trenchii]|uniref:EF-hand domain-containing protein n=1 Tax=Durusdinium trenchii TaxID=1381693 RepID=A0ABP0HHZ8_9DINO
MKMMDHPNIIKLYESFEDLRSGTNDRGDASKRRDPPWGEALTTKAGTPYYVAPQAGYGCSFVDTRPFFGETDADVLAKVRLGNFNFNPADWKNVLGARKGPVVASAEKKKRSEPPAATLFWVVCTIYRSDDAKSLIRWMLKMNPRDRYSAARRPQWRSSRIEPLRSNFVDNLRGFQSQNKLKKAALHIIAGQLNEDEIKKLREAFTSLDKNGDGLLTHSELKDGLGKAGLKEIPPDLAAIMDGVDADGSGVIDYTEFLAATLDRQQYMKEDVCWAAFRVFDRNGDGHISTQELKQVLQSSEVEDALGLKAIADLMVEVDSNGDGMIDFEEFMAMMRGSGEKRGEPTRSATGAPKVTVGHRHSDW